MPCVRLVQWQSSCQYCVIMSEPHWVLYLKISKMPSSSLGVFRIRKIVTIAVTICDVLVSFFARGLNLDSLNLHINGERVDNTSFLPNLKNILMFVKERRSRGTIPVLIRGWNTWYASKNLKQDGAGAKATIIFR